MVNFSELNICVNCSLNNSLANAVALNCSELKLSVTTDCNMRNSGLEINLKSTTPHCAPPPHNSLPIGQEKDEELFVVASKILKIGLKGSLLRYKKHIALCSGLQHSFPTTNSYFFVLIAKAVPAASPKLTWKLV